MYSSDDDRFLLEDRMRSFTITRHDLMSVDFWSCSLIALALLTLPIDCIAQDSVNILPLGDSITQADKNHDSYRRSLWHMLRNAGYKIDFVGSLTRNHNGGPPSPDFDLDHEGHWGWRADEIINGRIFQGKLAKWLQEYTPDIVLIHLGSNDVFQGQSVLSTVEELDQIISILRRDNPRVKVLIAKLIPVTEQKINNRINALNDAIPRISLENDSPESRVIVVDLNNNFDAHRDTYDGVHPNSKGEQKMAQQWLDSLQPLISPTIRPSAELLD